MFEKKIFSKLQEYLILKVDVCWKAGIDIPDTVTLAPHWLESLNYFLIIYISGSLYPCSKPPCLGHAKVVFKLVPKVPDISEVLLQNLWATRCNSHTEPKRDSIIWNVNWCRQFPNIFFNVWNLPLPFDCVIKTKRFTCSRSASIKLENYQYRHLKK